MDNDERQVADRHDEIQAALNARGVKFDSFYEEDGGEGWHITISAGEEVPIDGGGCDPEFGLTFWTRSDEWLWGYVTPHHERSGPWPARELDAGSTPDEVAEFVVAGLNAYGHDDCKDEDCMDRVGTEQP